MDRYEFINTLRAALTGKVPATMVEDNVRYYEEYIEVQLRQGKSENDVLSGLGDPRLLAKTVIEANKYAEGSETYGRNDSYEEEVLQGGSGKSFSEWYHALPNWFHVAARILITVCVLFMVFTVLRVIFPLIVFTIAVVFIYRLVRRFLL